MRFTVQRETLLKPLQMTAGVVERRHTLPILSNVLVRVAGNHLAITSTDLEAEMVAYGTVESAEDGEVTLPARKFTDICRTLPEGARVELAVDNDRALLRSGKSRFVLSTLPAAEFPNIETLQQAVELQVPQGLLKRLIDRTQFAMAQQDVRYYLNGLLLELAGSTLRTVATDGHRLALSERQLKMKDLEIQQVIIPRKGVLELARLLEDKQDEVTLQIGVNHIRVSTEEMSFTSKLIDGRFPDYQRVLPQNPDKVAVCERDALRQALTRASILSNERYRSVRFQFTPGALRVLANNPDQEEAEEEISIDYDSDPVEIGFNATYILDAISAIDEEKVKLLLTDSNSCCLIQGMERDDCKYVVMPMRI